MSDETFDKAPDVECPACGHEWHEADSFEIDVGSELDCPACGETIECVGEEWERWWQWGLGDTVRRATTPERGGEGS